MTFIERWRRPSSYLNRNSDDVVSDLQTEMNKLLGTFFPESVASSQLLKKPLWSPSVDLRETDSEYILTADLPGFNKNEIHISVDNNLFTIKGERKSEENKSTDKYHCNERYFGSFERVFSMPPNSVDKEKVSAKFENGILTVNLAKATEAKKEVRKIEIR